MVNKRTVRSNSGSRSVTPQKMAKPSSSQNSDDPSVDWRSSKATLKQGFEYLYNNELYSDVDLIVGEGEQAQRIPAHKLVLSLRSVVFARMLSEDWSGDEVDKGKSKDEINKKGSKVVITVKDVEPEAFTALLKFLYYDHLEFEGKTVMFVLQAAQMYQVFPLVDHCVKYLIKNLDNSNAFDLLMQAQFFSVPGLVKSCLEFLDDNIGKAVKSEGFLKIDLDSLCLVLERDSLRIREFDLFQAVVRWAKSQCKEKALRVTPKNQLSVLTKEKRKALYLLRFPLMSVSEFSSKDVAESGLLSSEEVSSMLLYLVRSDKPKVPFSKIPRASRKEVKEPAAKGGIHRVIPRTLTSSSDDDDSDDDNEEEEESEDNEYIVDEEFVDEDELDEDIDSTDDSSDSDY